MEPSGAQFEHEFLEVGDARLHYVRAGEGPLVVLLHGFPQNWYSLRHQLADLSRDHLAVALDLRGFGESSQPTRLEQYGCLPSVGDLEALAAKLGYEQFVLLGHDWGAGVAWATALCRPDLLEALIILSTPHPATFDRAMRESSEQQQASAYMNVVRQETIDGRPVAEIVADNNFALLRGPLEVPYVTEDALQSYVNAWAKPGVVAAMLRWYQVHGIGPGDEAHLPLGNYLPAVADPMVHVPTQVIYPADDVFTRPPAHDGLDKWVPDLTFQTVPDAGHWIAEEHPELVNASIREFLGTRTRTAA